MSLSPEAIAQAAKLYAEGSSLETLVADYSSSYYTLRTALIRHGVKLRTWKEARALQQPRAPRAPQVRTSGWDGVISNKHLMLRLI